MARQSWLVDSVRIATKIKSASEAWDHARIKWKSNPTRPCPNCNYIIDNNEVIQDWPGLPKGVKFDPSDQELLWHLLAKVGVDNLKPHPFIDEFIPTVDESDGICYTHPENLPGVKRDGSISHFFHKTLKAYNIGNRKRRKIHNDVGDIRWHKTGKTKPIIIDGEQKGCKKIMVLYLSTGRGEKCEKTNWVMHQYHLGCSDDEREGEYVVSKIFCQQLSKSNDKNDIELHVHEVAIDKIDSAAPNSVTPDPPCFERQSSTYYLAQKPIRISEDSAVAREALLTGMSDIVSAVDKKENKVMSDCDGKLDHEDNPSYLAQKPVLVTEESAMVREVTFRDVPGTVTEADEKEERATSDCTGNLNHEDNPSSDDWKLWEIESQFLPNSQQLAEALSLFDELLHSQSSSGGGGRGTNTNLCLGDYTCLGADVWKKDLAVCQNLCLHDDPNVEQDPSLELRLSQLEFGSQDSFLAWAGGIEQMNK